ncbi:MAG: hypothetical protein K0S65_6806, partial [Labilithrix sp.]|nr:hypothetical protein [Labilithrix sp.]
EEGRWLPLNVVELKIKADSKLPGAVCSGGAGSIDGSGPSTGNSSGPSQAYADAGVGTGYPSPDDPALECTDDGYAYTYKPIDNCVPPPPPPEGLCAASVNFPMPICAGSTGGSIPRDSEPPPGWPCTINLDGGAPDPDAGVPDTDAGAGG